MHTSLKKFYIKFENLIIVIEKNTNFVLHMKTLKDIDLQENR